MLKRWMKIGKGKGARAMGEEKKEDPTKKLEEEFHDFQKEWKKFLTNDFHHLVENVDILIKQNDKQHDEIRQGVELMQGNMGTMKTTIDTLLEVNKQTVTILERLK